MYHAQRSLTHLSTQNAFTFIFLRSHAVVSESQAEAAMQMYKCVCMRIGIYIFK